MIRLLHDRDFKGKRLKHKIRYFAPQSPNSWKLIDNGDIKIVGNPLYLVKK